MRSSTTRRFLAATLAVVLTGATISAGAGTAHAATVHIPDPSLARCLADELGVPVSADVDEAALAAVTYLGCGGEGVADLTGLEKAVGLTDLRLWDNAISDVGPLAALTQLETLDISMNHINYLRPLESLEYLEDLDAADQTVSLRIPTKVATRLPFGSIDGAAYFDYWRSSGITVSNSWNIKAKKGGRYEISVALTDEDEEGYSFDITFEITAAKAKTFKAPKPKVTGASVVGQTLSVDTGAWKPQPAQLSYQWYRSGKRISGAVATSYLLTQADKGKKITVKVTANQYNEYKRKTVTSKKTAKVKAA